MRVLRGDAGALTGGTGPLLAERLLAGAMDRGTGLGGHGALALVGLDRENHLLEGLQPLFPFKLGNRELLVGAAGTVCAENFDLHSNSSPFCLGAHALLDRLADENR